MQKCSLKTQSLIKRTNKNNSFAHVFTYSFALFLLRPKFYALFPALIPTAMRALRTQEAAVPRGTRRQASILVLIEFRHTPGGCLIVRQKKSE